MKQYNIKTLFTFFVAITVLFSSCQKDGGEVESLTGAATVTVKMSGIGSEAGSAQEEGSGPVARAAAHTKTTAANTVQHVEVPFGDGLVVRGTLSELTASNVPSLRATASKAVTTPTGPGQIVAFNGDYTIYIYKEGSTTLEKAVEGKAGANTKFDLAPGRYKFVVSAYGKPAVTGADRDPLAVEIVQTVTAGNNILDIVLKHKLTEVTVKFSAVGYNIISIAGGTVKPNFDYTFDAPTGTVAFAQEITAKGLTFRNGPTRETMNSDPVMIAVDNSNGQGEVKLTGVKLSGNKGGNITLPGLTLKKGVQYALELKLENPGIEIGGEIWSNGNLEYNPQTGEYHFGNEMNSIGDYWFENRIKPKVLSQSNPTPNDALNGKDGELGGDPCALVLPKGRWRIPTVEEAQKLINLRSRYVGYYDGTAATDKKGMFFGTNIAPGANAANYVFFPYAGYYPAQGTVAEKGTAGAYIVKNGAYKRFWMTGNMGANANGGATASIQDVHQTWAMQIRCVKN